VLPQSYYRFHLSSRTDSNYVLVSSREWLVVVKYDDENVSLSATGIAVSDSRSSFSPEPRLPDTERRRSARIPMRKPVVLSWQEGESERVEAVFTTTISRFGCALRSRMFFKPGTRVRLDFAKKSIEGRVVHSLKDHSTNVVTIGVAFDEDAGQFWQVGFEFWSRPL